MRTLVVVSMLAVGLAGCKSRPKHKAPPANPSTPSGVSGGSAGQPAPDLQLPKSAGGPPKKTTAPLAKADFDRLAKLRYPGFTAQVRTVGEKVFEVRQMTEGHPRLWATVTIQPCLDCVPMDVEKWRAKIDDLRVLLGPLKDAPGVSFEVGGLNLNGQPVVYTYQLGTSNGVDGDSKIAVAAEPKVDYAIIDRQGDKTKPTVIVRRVEEGQLAYSKRAVDCTAKTWTALANASTLDVLVAAKQAAGSATTPAPATADEAIVTQACKAATGPGLNYAFTDAVALYYNDGVNQIRVVAEYKDDPRSLEDLQKAAPKDDLARLGLAFLDVYTHEW